MEGSIPVRMAEIQFSPSGDAVFVLPGLGSCIGLVIYDPERRLAGMAHVMLPDSTQARESAQPGKFADTAVDALVLGLVERGARRAKLVAKMAGGAQMFGTIPSLNVGERNAQAVRGALQKKCIPVLACDVGGSSGRTIHFEVATGELWVRSRGGEARPW